MNPSLTISQLLQQNTKFEMAFWVSYSIDIETLAFLLRMDFRPNMDPCVLHVLCDHSKLSKTMEQNSTPEGLNNLQHLQAYCTISSQFVERSFHPKILFLASHNSILTFVSSANATNSGILSNQDFIGSFSSNDAQSEINPEIISIYNYLRRFTGWCKGATDELDSLAEHFPLLLSTQASPNVLTIPSSASLLAQMMERQTAGKGLKQINIFTPFLDPMMEAVFQIRQEFKVPVNVVSPQKEFITARSDRLPNDIKFYKSSGNGKSTFHAKCYEFQYEDESVLYWGSANCSYSGLISATRNAEILIRSVVSKESVEGLWGTLDTASAQKVKYADTMSEENESVKHPDIILLSAIIESDFIGITSNRPIADGVIKFILVNGSEAEYKLESQTGTNYKIQYPKIHPMIVFIELDGHPISNKLFLNYPFRIESRINNPGSSEIQEARKRDFDSIISNASGLFSVSSTSKSNKTLKADGTFISRRFWTMPEYRQSQGFRSTERIQEFINRRVATYRARNDEENEDIAAEAENDSSHQKADIKLDTLVNYLRNLSRNLHKYENPKIFKDIDLGTWFQDLDFVNVEFIEHLERNQIPRNYEQYHQLLYYLSSIATWMMEKDVSQIEGLEYSVDLIMNIQDLYLLFSIYAYLCPGRPKGIKLECMINDIKRALYHRFIVRTKVEGIHTSAEHNEMILSNSIDKLFLRRIAYDARNILQNHNLYIAENLAVVETILWKGRHYLVLGLDRGRILLEWIIPGVESMIPVLSNQLFRNSNPNSIKTINI